jgi:type II secretion system protein J
MLAIAIFAGVMTAIYATWTSILRSAQVAQAAAAEVQRSRMAVRALEEALLGARVPLMVSRAARRDEQHYAFLANGDPAEPFLSFVSQLPSSFPRGGRFGGMQIRRVTFNLEQDGAGGNLLVLRQVPLLFDPDQDEEENPLVLAKDVEMFALEFWNVRAGEWETEWPATNRVPPLIRFTLDIAQSQAGRLVPPRRSTRLVPMVGSGALTGIRSPAQAPGAEPVVPPSEAPLETPGEP